MQIYYTYKWLREDGTPYYVGKGKGNRAWTVHKRKNVSHYPPAGRVEIVMEGITEEEALLHEIWLIALYGRKCDGGILINLSTGGQGPSNAKWKWSQESIERLKARPPRKFSDQARRNISLGKQGKSWGTHTEETKQKQRAAALRPEAQPAHKKAAQSRAVSETNSKKQPCPQCGMLMNVGNLTKHIKGTRCKGR